MLNKIPHQRPDAYNNSFTLCTLLLIVCFTLSACATSYSSSGVGGGYSDTKLSPDMFRVKFNGNGYTTPDRAQDFALLRAADLTLTNGYSYFAVINESNQVSHESYTTPGQVNTYGNYNSSTGTYSATSYYNPGTTLDFYMPSAGLLIQCFHTKQQNWPTFDAAFLESSIRGKYKLPAYGAKN